MEKILVHVEPDHIEYLSRVKKPILAVCELIWNGLDANANKVQVVLRRNRLRGLESVIVIDDGHGLPTEEAEAAFGNLGGSWKKDVRTTRKGDRLLHGKAGKGRFRAFFLGSKIEWETRYERDGQILTYKIVGDSKSPGEFQMADEKSAPRMRTGTQVHIRNLKKKFTSLDRSEAIQEVTEQFSLYLSLYPSVVITYDGVIIDPAAAMESQKDYTLDDIKLEDGTTADVKLTIIEWKTKVQARKLYLCDSNGFTYHDLAPGIHAPGFNFTAYLKTDIIRDLDDAALLLFEEWHPDLKAILTAAKKTISEHFKQRSIEKAGEVINNWKREQVYPYIGEPRDIVEKTGRQVFDLCAINLPQYLPDFEQADLRSKRLSLKLLRHALETNPTAARKILNEVLELPAEKQQEFAELLDKTSLEAVISASKIVADRLDFLKGLEILVFEPKSREQLLERKQLHRIIAENTWVFGEQFNLTVDDESLTQVLRKHLENTGREIAVDQPVTRENGSEGLIDLMLSRQVPQSRPEEREHLIIELKRPKVNIDDTAISQIKSYAFAVKKDERFKGTKTNWIFWAVSNDISETIKWEANQANRPEGLLYIDKDEDLTIWVKTWGQIIDSSWARLKFFQEKLEYTATQRSATEHLHKAYEKYLPSCLSDN